jgi:hypothetical protein
MALRLEVTEISGLAMKPSCFGGHNVVRDTGRVVGIKKKREKKKKKVIIKNK